MTLRRSAGRRFAALAAILGLGLVLSALPPIRLAHAADEAQPAKEAQDAAGFPIMQKRFEQFVRRYVDAQFAFNPPSATGAGMHAYDAKLPDVSPGAIAQEERRIRAALTELGEIDREQLAAPFKIDYDLYHRKVEGDLFSLTEERRLENDPGRYNVGWALDPLISQEFAPPEARLRSLVGRLEATPRFLAQARENLKRPPRLFTEFAIEEFPGTIEYLETTVPKAFASVKDKALWSKYAAALKAAKAAVDEHVAWMKSTLLPRSDGSFVLGPELYRKKLYYEEMVDTPLDTLLSIGQRELDRLEARYKVVAATIVPGGTVADALAKVRGNHPPKDSLLIVARSMLERARSFSESSGFLKMPSEERCEVRATPEFAASRSFASLDSPGPLETTGRKGYYNISLPDAGWNAARTEEYLQGFSRGPLSSVSLHEAYPGHYAHYLYGRDATSLARKTAGCGSFAEGWGLYVEQGMLDQGYGGGDPELEFGMLKWALVRACRYQVGLRVHTKGMSLEEATKFFQDHAGMEPVNAEREAYRAAFDPTYLVYTLGALQIRKLRDDLKAEQGAAFDLGKFHATILSQGSLPVALLRRMLLKNEGTSL
ncbi:MAG TPA: DUF885 domain-containing protein [Candidatus Eisenbacteria bacterium]|nr:DUF885 domain-containing protein [Candidatus Eisenbacteria bacterium]